MPRNRKNNTVERLIVTPSKSEDLPIEELHPLTNLTNLEVAGQYRDTQLPPQIIRHLTKLKELYIETKEQFEELDLSSFWNLEGLHFSATINPADPLSIVPYPQRLIRMSISDAALSKADTNKLQLFSNLKDLRIFEEYGSTNPIEPLAIPHLPNLEKLALLVPTGSISPLNTKLTFLCVNEIAKKGNLRELSNLKVLEMHWVGSSKLDLLTNLESLRLLSEDEKNINDTLRSVSATLTALEVQSAYFELPSITKLSNLQSLDFSMVQGEFPLNVISSLASTLTQLKLQTIPQEEFPTLASFTKLKVLEVFRNNFGGPFPIYKLINLESLTSDGSSYLRAEDIQRLSNLTYLLVNNIPFDSVAAMTKLRDLIISYCDKVTDNTVTKLQSLTNLTSLQIQMQSGSTFTGVTLTRLTFLRELILATPYPIQVSEKELMQAMPKLSMCQFYVTTEEEDDDIDDEVDPEKQ